MSYMRICDKCGCNLTGVASMQVQIAGRPSRPDNTKDFCPDCFKQIEQFMTSKHAEIAYHTPGAR